MGIVSNIVLIVISASLTGSIFSLIWILLALVGKIFLRGDVLYAMLKFAILMFFVPSMYIILVVKNFAVGNSIGFFGLMSKGMNYVLCGIFIIMLTAFIRQVVSWIFGYIRLRHVCSMRLPTTLAMGRRVEAIRTKLGIKRKFHVYQGFRVRTPFIYGVFKTNIYFPVADISDENFDMILTHEMLHFKQRDVFWKPIANLMCCIHWFNPLAWLDLALLKRWAEASCDYKCCTKGELDAITYIEMLVDEDFDLPKEAIGLVSMWSINEKELKWRADCMIKFRYMKLKKSLLALTSAVALFAGSLTVFAATDALEDTYNYAYENTKYETEDDGEAYKDDNKEYTETLEDLEAQGISFVEGKWNEETKGTKSFTWSIPASTTMHTGAFWAKKGNTITISTSATPNDATYKIGIVQPDGSMRYSIGTGVITHTFAVTQTGFHQVYVTNTSAVNISVTGWATY